MQAFVLLPTNFLSPCIYISSGGVQLGLLVAAIFISVACICLPIVAMMCVDEDELSDDFDWGG